MGRKRAAKRERENERRLSRGLTFLSFCVVTT